MSNLIPETFKKSGANIWLVAVDGSDQSYGALENIGKICFEKDTVILLMVTKGIRFDSSSYNEQKEKQDKECEITLKRYKEYCKERKIKFLTEIAAGDPREVILSSAKRHRATYIAMGSRGLTGLKSILMGSVSSYIVESSPIPVLVTK